MIFFYRCLSIKSLFLLIMWLHLWCQSWVASHCLSKALLRGVSRVGHWVMSPIWTPKASCSAPSWPGDALLHENFPSPINRALRRLADASSFSGALPQWMEIRPQNLSPPLPIVFRYSGVSAFVLLYYVSTALGPNWCYVCLSTNVYWCLPIPVVCDLTFSPLSHK